MVTNLQFGAVAAYLLWCLFASLITAFEPADDDVASILDESGQSTPLG
jgi:hypothetical protein